MVAPTITAQPSSQTITAGQTATFSVAASGTAPLSYQWQKMPSGGSYANISGATGTSYTTPVTTTADSGSQFRCVVTNSAGAATSNGATLTVNATSGPANDNFANRTHISGTSATMTGTNVGASKEAGEQNVAFSTGGSNGGGK